MNLNPYESPTTPPQPAEPLAADARAMGKVFSVVLGLFLVCMGLMAACYIYALRWVSIAPP